MRSLQCAAALCALLCLAVASGQSAPAPAPSSPVTVTVNATTCALLHTLASATGTH